MPRVFGTAMRPRVKVRKSNTAIYCTLTNDQDNKIIMAVSSSNIDTKKNGNKKNNCNKEKARKLGELLGDRIKERDIKEIVFDRGPYLYHGKVMALADGIREKGIKF
ncbi:MAG: 50S ribosomal protein L18 [Cytophagales bacterium]|nr:50S ribosomal protein L18 [Cytophagales bacterium]